MSKRSQLLDAHVRFQLNQYQGEGLRSLIQQEVAAAWQWGHQTTLGNVMTAQQLTDGIIEILMDFPLNEAIQQHVQQLVTLLDASQTHNRKIRDVIADALFEDTVEQIISMEEIRKAVIHEVLNHSLYASMISDVLYSAIKSYLLDENQLASKVPGMSSMVKMGKWATSKAAPKLEKSIDGTIRSFIHANIKSTVDLSETILNNALHGDAIRGFTDEVWLQIRDKNIQTLFDHISGEDIETFSALAIAFWNDLAQSSYARDLLKELATGWFQANENIPISQLLEAIGIDESRVVEQLSIHAAPLIESAPIQALLEQRIRAQLESFYDSADARALLDAEN